MMTTAAVEKKHGRMCEIIGRFERVLVAFSGGVDSTLLLKVAVDALGPDNVLAVTADSPSVPRHAVEEAVELADRIGATHRVIETHELDDPRYSANPFDRCYFCRLDLHAKLESIAEDEGYDAVLTGANADDSGDWRPGQRAGREFGVRNPCADAGMTKADIRMLSKELALPTHDKPAGPCLATRIAYGIPITRDVLRQIEQAENCLRRFGLDEFRVRHHGDLARIEVPPDRIAEFAEPNRRADIVAGLTELGYKYVTLDLAGFRSGSMNEVIDQIE